MESRDTAIRFAVITGDENNNVAALVMNAFVARCDNDIHMTVVRDVGREVVQGPGGVHAHLLWAVCVPTSVRCCSPRAVAASFVVACATPETSPRFYKPLSADRSSKVPMAIEARLAFVQCKTKDTFNDFIMPGSH